MIPPPFVGLRAVRAVELCVEVWVEGAMRTQAANRRLSVGTSRSAKSWA